MAQGEGGGRPQRVFTTDEVRECEVLAAVCSKQQIADYFDIHEDTLRAIEKRQPEVFRALKRGKVKAVASVDGGILQRARSGDNAAAFFYMKCQAGWSEKIQLEADFETHVTLQLDGKTVDVEKLGW